MISSGHRAILLVIGGLLFAMASARADFSHIVIVKSSDNLYFNQSIEALTNRVDEAVEFKVVMAEDLADYFDYALGNRLFVALGQTAVEAVTRLDDRVNSYNAYLTHEQYQSMDISDQVTVLLDQPLYRYLGFCKLMPMTGSIGVITDSPLDLGPNQSDLLRNLDIELNQYQPDPLNKLLPVLRELLQQNDLLLMLPRRKFINRDTLKGVLLTSYRSRRPVISYSPAHVRSGALASIYSSPVDIGRHLAMLVNQRLKDPSRRHPGLQFARFYSIATNRRVARALDIAIPGETEIRSRLDAITP